MAAAAFRTALGRIGWNVASQNEVTRADGQNLELEFLADMQDEDAEELFTALRRPGDNVAIAGGGEAPRPGVTVSTHGRSNFKLLCHMVRHYRRTGRTLTAAEIEQGQVQHFRQSKLTEQSHENPDTTLRLIETDTEHITQYIEQFPEHLALYKGTDGHPLSYVIREVEEVPDAGDDPMFGEDDSNYNTIEDELISRGALMGDSYNQDNRKVFDLLCEGIVDHSDVYQWIRPFARSKNGRQAFLAFRTHYMGDAFMNALYDKADRQLLNLRYTGERPRYNFERHVSLH